MSQESKERKTSTARTAKNRVKMVISVDGLTPTGALALEAFLAMAQKLGTERSSRWLSLYVDGGWDFRPTVQVCVENQDAAGEYVGGDKTLRKAKVHKLVGEKTCWFANNSEWRLDPAWITANHHVDKKKIDEMQALRFTVAAEINNFEVDRFVFENTLACDRWLRNDLPKLQHKFGVFPVRVKKLKRLGPGDNCCVRSCGDEIFTIKEIKRVAEHRYQFVMANRTLHDVALCYPVSAPKKAKL